MRAFRIEPVTFTRMYLPVDTKDSVAVEREVQAVYLEMFPQGDPMFVPTALVWIKDCFAGRYKDHQASDARYHDLEHTLQGTLCMARLLHGRHVADATPVVTQSAFQLGLLAILFHDAGYLKKQGETGGTGAKYTLTHVTRSVQFAGEFLEELSGELHAASHVGECVFRARAAGFTLLFQIAGVVEQDGQQAELEGRLSHDRCGVGHMAPVEQTRHAERSLQGVFQVVI